MISRLKIITYYIGLLLTTITLTYCVQNDPSDKLPKEFEKIKDRNIDNEELEKAIAVLDSTIIEKPDFWVKIVRDSCYSHYHRSAAATMYFKRHVKQGMLLKDISSLLSCWSLDHHIVYRIPSEKEGRKIHRNGGSWKDVGYFFTVSELQKTDTVFNKFYSNVSVKNGKLFFISLFEGYGFDHRTTPPYVISGVCLGLSGDIDEKEMLEYLRFGNSVNGKNITVIDLYIYRLPRSALPVRNKDDDI